MMFRRLFISIIALTLQLSLQSVAAQMVTAQQESQDSTINVVAYFCKNDTLTYLFQDYEAKVENNDTIVDHYIKSEIQLVVVDSTSSGYLIEYTPLQTTIEQYEDTLLAHAMQSILETMGEVKYLLSTDEYGAVQHIKNWPEVKDYTKKAFNIVFDSLYANYPQLNEILPRQRFEAQIASYYANENAFYNKSDDLLLLFPLHGKSLPIGKTERDGLSDNGYPQHLVMVTSYGKGDEEYGFDDDYYIHCTTETTVPKEEVKELIRNSLNMMFSDKYLIEMNQGIDSVECTEAKIIDAERYNYFYNGWPCEMLRSKVTNVMGKETIEIKNIAWTTRRWGVFGGGEAQDEGVSL